MTSQYHAYLQTTNFHLVSGHRNSQTKEAINIPAILNLWSIGGFNPKADVPGGFNFNILTEDVFISSARSWLRQCLRGNSTFAEDYKSNLSHILSSSGLADMKPVWPSFDENTGLSEIEFCDGERGLWLQEFARGKDCCFGYVTTNCDSASQFMSMLWIWTRYAQQVVADKACQPWELRNFNPNLRNTNSACRCSFSIWVSPDFLKRAEKWAISNLNTGFSEYDQAAVELTQLNGFDSMLMGSHLLSFDSSIGLKTITVQGNGCNLSIDPDRRNWTREGAYYASHNCGSPIQFAMLLWHWLRYADMITAFDATT